MIEWLKRLWDGVWRFVDELSLELGVWAQSGDRPSAAGRRTDGGGVRARALVVAAIAVAFLLWAKSSGKLDAFFDAIFDEAPELRRSRSDAGARRRETTTVRPRSRRRSRCPSS